MVGGELEAATLEMPATTVTVCCNGPVGELQSSTTKAEAHVLQSRRPRVRGRQDGGALVPPGPPTPTNLAPDEGDAAAMATLCSVRARDAGWKVGDEQRRQI